MEFAGSLQRICRRKRWKTLLIQAGGAYSGIGVEVTMENNRVTVIAPIAGPPAEKAGLLPGDQIVEVNGKNIEGLPLNDAVKDIRGKVRHRSHPGHRPGRPARHFPHHLTRARIERSSLKTEMLVDGMGYLALSQFADNSDAEFTKAIRQLKDQGTKGLILDPPG